ncbi:hypothetical protein EMCRGX_G009876 [Ephydatia muelleri]
MATEEESKNVDVIKQGIWCDTWLSPWFLWVTSFTSRLHALQKLVGKSTVSLRMSIAKHVKSSIEKAAQNFWT